jgi:leucyl/phenylalanyl-tRNA--protein transferase
MAPSFPWLNAEDEFRFPDPRRGPADEPFCRGGNLSPGMLISAYRQGIFPWYSEGQPVLWWSPDPRFVLFPEKLHVGATMKKILRQKRFEFSADTDFEAVIRACSEVPRPDQEGTWITEDMIEAYGRLHDLGLAHSVEVKQDGVLVGGLYGVAVGRVFCGESMFSRVSNGSRAGFMTLVSWLKSQGFRLIDAQVHNDYIETLGVEPIPRRDYLSILRGGLDFHGLEGSWKDSFP